MHRLNESESSYNNQYSSTTWLRQSDNHTDKNTATQIWGNYSNMFTRK